LDSSEFSLHAEVEDYHWWFSARREILLELLQRQVPPATERLVVEIGCGTGGNLKYLQNHYRVMGVELSPTAADLARQRVDCPIFTGDFTEELVPYWDEIDAVILADVLEHINDDAAFLRQVIASMKEGASLLISVPAHPFLWSSHDRVLRHLRRYTAPGLRRLWQGQAVTELLFTPINCLLFPPIVLYRWLSRSWGQENKSHLKRTSPAINRLLHLFFSIERLWLKHIPLPFGCSYCVLLQKNKVRP